MPSTSLHCGFGLRFTDNGLKSTTMTINFIESAADPNKGFRIGREQSVFVGNVTFKVTGVKFGNYQLVEDGQAPKDTKYASTSQAILFTTDAGEDLPLSRLLNKRRIIYDKEGHAILVESCDFKAKLREHLETLGRREDDSAMLKGSVKEVADKALEFFNGKTLRVIEVEGFGRDDKNRLVPLLSPCIQFTFAE